MEALDKIDGDSDFEENDQVDTFALSPLALRKASKVRVVPIADQTKRWTPRAPNGFNDHGGEEHAIG